MKRAVFVLALVCVVLCLPVLAQSPEVKDFVAVGASWNQYAQPPISGAALYAHQINGGTYSFSLVDIISKSVTPFTTTTSISTGVAQHVRDIGKAHVFVTTTVGVASGGENVGYAWTGGGAVVFPLGRGWALMPNVRVLKSSLTDLQLSYGLAVGFGK